MNAPRRITFVLPRTGEWPSGGLRVVYEYANHLARRGHSVSVVHPCWLVANPGPLDHVRNALRYAARKLDGRFTPEKWFDVDPRVRLLCVPSLSERFIPDGDVVVATAWQTAEWVSRYTSAKGRGFYFIQHLETWNGTEQRVYATWRSPLRKIVIAKWLAEGARELGESATYIPNGLDVDGFPLLTPWEVRRHNQLMMLYHKAEWKGSDDGLEAIRLVAEKEPGVRVNLFGTSMRPKELPAWMEYHRLPSPQHLRKLYNEAAIFVAPSRTEGWGLPACEAMLSGAALVATDIDGHREFAFHGETALTSAARSPGDLAENILRLIRDPELRIQLAKNGFQFVRQFTWDRATNAFEAALCGP